ncbi:hypothetical protein QNA08_09255 [Chelatococcus sp. SYSU_G07232]|uniref:Uncharacterized protein n=1 Tax=Chelatococcus albus TaxID=3047466 RepID=A0ABT7AGC8_9HYPH|nr:hypothetical protein [Chelatococcus sp. SYSU_G07232]MDJ1158419.1 hypothetical protein [Chelatococcus sp. SYSU_G07232]
MEYKPLSDLNLVADLQPVEPRKPMSRRERLERWAEVLEREPERVLSALEEIEWRPRAERLAMRADNSPLSVAYADDVLRAEGLASDKLGDAMDFFQLTEGEAHCILCSCMGGQTILASEAARRARCVIAPKLWSLYAH